MNDESKEEGTEALLKPPSQLEKHKAHTHTHTRHTTPGHDVTHTHTLYSYTVHTLHTRAHTSSLTVSPLPSIFHGMHVQPSSGRRGIWLVDSPQEKKVWWYSEFGGYSSTIDFNLGLAFLDWIKMCSGSYIYIYTHKPQYIYYIYTYGSEISFLEK
jgi:hypothetical protein